MRNKWVWGTGDILWCASFLCSGRQTAQKCKNIHGVLFFWHSILWIYHIWFIQFPVDEHFGCILLLSCISLLCILDTSPLSEVCVANIFSQFMACFLIFTVMSARAKVFHFDKVHFFKYFPFQFYFGVPSKKSLCSPTLKMFSPINFMVLPFTIKSIIHCELSFCICHDRKVEIHSFCHADVLLFLYHLLKKNFSPC